MNIRRSKHPEAVREQILQAAKQVLSEEGAAALTFDRILSRTDLSKGGIQYHFPSKQAMLDALFDHLMARFVAALNASLNEEPAGPHRKLRAYIKTVSQAVESAADAQEAAALLMLDPKYQVQHTKLVDEFCRSDATEAGLALSCRYAMDGLWHVQAFSRRPHPAHAVTQVRDCLLSLLV